MNTLSKRTPLPTQSSSKTTAITNNRTNITRNTTSQPESISRGLQTDLPPIGQTPVLLNNQSRSAPRQSSPLPSSLRAPSILKKSPTGLSQEKFKPLSKQTLDKIGEDLRRSNEITIDGTYRGQKLRLSLKPNQPTVSFNLPPPPSSSSVSRARQSISRSEKLLFN